MKNPYKGINAHLNSLLQSPADDSQPALWSSFHASHINHLADFLNDVLPDGYIAMLVRSECAEEFHTAVVIYEVEEQGRLGKVVTRIELLSPSNMPRQSGYSAYRTKRIENLRSGIPLIEIDYLHEFESPIVNFPQYPHDENSTAYYIALSDPRPTWDEGTVKVYGSSVDEPLKSFPIPLGDDRELIFDIDAVYQHTFERRRYHTLVDYTDVPERFDTYSESDTLCIQAVMTQRQS